MATDSTERVPFSLPSGFAGVAVLRSLPLADGRVLVTCQDEDYGGKAAPVNQAAAMLFHAYCERHALATNRVVWLEASEPDYGPTGKLVGGWDQVAFKGRDELPVWRQMTKADWRRLGVDEVKAPEV